MTPTVKRLIKYSKYVLALLVVTLFAPFTASKDESSSTVHMPITPGMPMAKADYPTWGGGGNDNDDC